MVALIAIIAGIGALVFVPTAGASRVHEARISGTADDPGEPAYYDTRGYGICTRVFNPGTPYNLPAVQPGYVWTILVLKAGVQSETNDQYAEYPDPLPGTYYHPSSDPIDLIIRCKATVGTTTTASTTTTTTPDPCGPYTPRSLAINKTRANPGELVTVTGQAAGNDTLSVTLTSSKISPRSLGTRVTPPNGVFSIGVIMPEDIPVGATYTITLTSTYCARSGSVSLYIDPEVRSGCASTVPRVLIRGQATLWKMVSGSPVGFDRTKPLTLSLVQRSVGGYSTTLWTGNWGANGEATITAPLAAPIDRYYVVQSGTNKSTQAPKSESCNVRVADVANDYLVADRGGSDAWRQPVQIGVASLISLTALARLRVRHKVGRRQAA